MTGDCIYRASAGGWRTLEESISTVKSLPVNAHDQHVAELVRQSKKLWPEMDVSLLRVYLSVMKIHSSVF